MEKRKIKIEQEYMNYFEFMELMAKSYKEIHHKKYQTKKRYINNPFEEESI